MLKRKTASSNALLLGPAGKPACACCDDPYTPGLPCPYCDATTPKYATVTLSGITLCGPNEWGTVDGTYCLEQTGEDACEWQTWRHGWGCCKSSVGCLDVELWLDNGDLYLGVGPSVFVAIPETGVTACDGPYTLHNVHTACSGSSGYGGTATVDWGDCQAECQSCADGWTLSECDCAPETITLILSGIELAERRCIQDNGADLGACYECDGGGSDSISTSITCTYDPVTGIYYGSAGVGTICSKVGGAYTHTLHARVERIGTCVWAVGVIDNNSDTMFCGQSGTTPNCDDAVVVNNDSPAECFGNFCLNTPSGCWFTGGSGIGAGGTATVVPC